MDRAALGRLGALALGGVALACSVTVDAEPGTAEAGSTRAVIAITRSAPAATPDEARAEAFAGFLRTPATADPAGALDLTGLGLDLPAVGECRKGARNEAPTRRSLTSVELLDAGEVTLVAGGTLTTLAPRAFPTITDSVSGVVYTTRDRTASPLPAATGYTVATSGGSSLEAISGEGHAPASLTNVELGGEAMGEVETLAAGKELTLDWTPGATGDRVYVEIVGGAEPSTCAFADGAGHGALPGSLLPPGRAAVTVHRLREVAFADAGLARGALRFDFELSASVTFE